MLNNFNKNAKKIFKHLPENLLTISTKSAVYFGLAVYWSVIIVGTFLQIN